LANTEPVEELQRAIGAGSHRLVVSTRHIDVAIALLDPEMGGPGGRWRALFDVLRAGDTLVVRWIDRLGRNYTDVVDTIREFMRRGVIIKTVINGMVFDGTTTDPMQQAVRDALSAFMAATAQAQAEATKSAQRAGIDHKRRAQPNAYLGRKPSYDRVTFDRIRLALDSASPPSLSAVAKTEDLSKQTVFRLKQDPQAALAALDAWRL
jgi:putative DNA-invertase from lambdoid prophage Rac